MCAARERPVLRTEPTPPVHPWRQAHTFREAFLASVTPADLKEAATALLKKAKAGDVAAVRVLLDRCLGVAAVEQWRTEESVASMESLG